MMWQPSVARYSKARRIEFVILAVAILSFLAVGAHAAGSPEFAIAEVKLGMLRKDVEVKLGPGSVRGRPETHTILLDCLWEIPFGAIREFTVRSEDVKITYVVFPDNSERVVSVTRDGYITEDPERLALRLLFDLRKQYGAEDLYIGPNAGAARPWSNHHILFWGRKLEDWGELVKTDKTFWWGAPRSGVGPFLNAVIDTPRPRGYFGAEEYKLELKDPSAWLVALNSFKDRHAKKIAACEAEKAKPKPEPQRF